MITPQPKIFIKNPIFLSYTSLSDFLKCPRTFYLKNIYRDPKTGHRIQIASPYLSLGAVVHDVVKWYLEIKGQVTQQQVLKKYDNFWLKWAGKKGGFVAKEEEETFKERGKKMLLNFLQNASVLGKMIPSMSFPKYHLGENLVLVGNLDYVEEEENGLHVIDFKTGTSDEGSTFQLHIYAILAESNLGKPVKKGSFWYLDRDDKPKEVVLDSLEEKLAWIKEKGQQMKKAMKEGNWTCVKGEELCRDCQGYQAILEGKGQFQFSDYKYKKDVYFLPSAAF